MQKTLTVIDDFIRNPEQMILESKTLNYSLSKGGLANMISEKSKYTPGICRRLNTMYHCKTRWGPHSGTFRSITERQILKTKRKFYVHSDGVFDFTGLLYLNHTRECHGGTNFFRHKETGLDGTHDLEAIAKYLNKNHLTYQELLDIFFRDAQVPSKWALTDVVQMKFNRMIVFNGKNFHSPIYEFRKARPAKRLSYVCYGEII